MWAEAYRLIDGQAVHTYDDGPLAGEAAVVRKGNVITIGALSPILIARMLAHALVEAGIEVTPLDEGVRVSRTGGLTVWMNFTEDDATLPDGRALGPVSYSIG